MKFEKGDADKELFKKRYISPPATELLLNPSLREEAWPEDISRNEMFLAQVRERQTISDRIDEVTSRLPRTDMPLEKAVSEGLLTEEQTANLFDSLSSLLENDDYKRVLLYMPFEFLPSASWRTGSETLSNSMARFKSAYLEAWKAQLHTHDVRANFVDGDVLEVESRTDDLPRVVKAAHLIPKLVQNGLIKVEEVLEVMETSVDEVLRQSIKDAVIVLADLGLISDDEIARMRASKDIEVQGITRTIASFLDQRGENRSGENLLQVLSRIDAEKYSGISKKRAQWLRQEKKRKALEAAAGEIELAISRNTFPEERIEELTVESAAPENQQVAIIGVRKAIESAANLNMQEADGLYARYEGVLLSLWRREVSEEVREALRSTFYRLHGLGIVDQGRLMELKLAVPELARPFSENLLLMEQEMNAMREAVAAIESDPELSRSVYPVVLVFGSRLKGYSTTSADIDMAIFIKPDASFKNRKKIREELRNKFNSEKTSGEIVEFWLEETATGLNVRDFDKTDSTLGESYWTHVLFGAAWVGKKEAVRELREKLLVPYFYDAEKVIQGRVARGLYLEELERDTLQYRLMHKGYARFFAPRGGIQTLHADRIDGESMFWDSGYRHLALKLFARRVFLPKLNRAL